MAEGCRRGEICILGAALDTGNMGVSALAVSLVQLCHEISPYARIYLLVPGRQRQSYAVRMPAGPVTVETINYRLSPLAPLRDNLFIALLLAVFCCVIHIPHVRARAIRRSPLLSKIWHADFIGDVNGGDSFSDIYGLRLFLMHVIVRATIVLLGKPLHLLPQTLGPFRSALGRVLAKYIVRHAASVACREQKSWKTALWLSGNISGRGRGRDIRFCPDVAFTLSPMRPIGFQSIARPDGRKLIGLNISGLLYNGGYTKRNMFRLAFDYRRFVSQLLWEMVTRTDYDVLLVPHVITPWLPVEDDRTASRTVMLELGPSWKQRLYLVDGEYSESELKYIIGSCSFFIGSRMHACIAALSQGIPAVGVAYSSKFQGVFRSVGLGNMVVDARYIPIDEAIRTIVDMVQMHSGKSLGAPEIAKVQSQVRDYVRVLPLPISAG